MAYSGYLKDFAREFSSAFDKIAAKHNIELGDEFEIAVCETLRSILPERFGVCRGFIVNDKDEKAGDDIIIFDRQKFPTLRILPQAGFSRLQDIPAEAVCAYFEAKHSLYTSPSKAQQAKTKEPNLATALQQVGAAKSISRASVPLDWGGTFNKPVELGSGIKSFERHELMPDKLNPLYGGIISRHLRTSEEDASEPKVADLAAAIEKFGGAVRTDLIIAGSNVLAFPVAKVTGDKPYAFVTPFFVEGVSGTAVRRVDGMAWGIGVALLLEAIQLMKLGSVSWGAAAVQAANSVTNGEGGVLWYD